MGFNQETVKLVSWADKYEPRDFEAVISHEEAKTKILRALSDDQIAHFIFHGDSGSGKTVLAKLTANLFAQKFGEEEVAIRTYNASDDRGIGFIRNEIGILARSSGAMVFILDEADALTSEAQNALRAIMPEAKKRNKMFILTCNHYWKIEEAIKSRCRSFNIPRLTTTEIQTRLIQILKLESVRLKSQDEVEYIRKIIKQHKGDMRKSIDSLQEAVIGSEIDLEFYNPKDIIDDDKIGALLSKIIYKESIDAINIDVNSIIFRDDKVAIPDFFLKVKSWFYEEYKKEYICKNVYLRSLSILRDTDRELHRSGSPIIQISGMFAGFLLSKITECVGNHASPNDSSTV